MTESYSHNEMVESLREVASKVGHSPSLAEYQSEISSPSSSTISRHFDGWNNAKKEAGLEQNNKFRSINEEYFNCIDSQNKAYWLGLIYADGSVYQENGHDRFSIALKDSDKYLLEQFIEDTDSDYEIYYDTRKGNSSDMGHIIISNQEFIEGLKELGVDSEKTFSSILPEIDSIYHASFFRGIFDGDGSASSTQLKVTGASKKRLEKLSEWIPGKATVSPDTNSFSLQCYYVNDHDIVNWMYPEGNETEPMLERKFTIINQYC